MAFTVEDGTVVDGANSYLDVEDADAIIAEAGYSSTWAATDETVKETLLVRASLWLDAKHGKRYRGVRSTPSENRLAWPRTGATDDEDFPLVAVPLALRRAVALLASIFASSPPEVETSREIGSASVGPLSVSFDPSASRERQYPEVEGLMAQITSGGKATRRLVRG